MWRSTPRWSAPPKDVAPPTARGIEPFVLDPALAVVLGKALFWDAQVGSDGQACASFDHPSLRLFNGHGGDNLKVSDQNRDNRADDDFLLLPEVGSAGVAAASCMRNDGGSL